MKSAPITKRTSGFTLLEMAVVLVIVGVMAGLVLQVQRLNKPSECYESTEKQLATIRGAINAFVVKNQRLPVPAGRSLSSSHPKSGKETDMATDASNVDVLAGTVDLIFGALPFQTLGLPSSFAADCWGNKFSYVVTKNFTTTSGYADASAAGGITFNNGAVAAKINTRGNTGTGGGNHGGNHSDDDGHDQILNDDGNDDLINTPNVLDSVPNIGTGSIGNIGSSGTGTGTNVAPAAPAAVSILEGAAYVVISHGENGSKLGGVAENYSGASHGWCTLGDKGTTDEENCDITNSLIYVSNFNNGKDAGEKYNDDLVAFGTRRSIAQAAAGGALYAWGDNQYGQLGIGSTTDSDLPVKVGLPEGTVTSKVAAGTHHSCALTNVGAIYCWGRNNDGQLGDGTNNDSTVPLLISVAGVSKNTACVAKTRTDGGALSSVGKEKTLTEEEAKTLEGLEAKITTLEAAIEASKYAEEKASLQTELTRLTSQAALLKGATTCQDSTTPAAALSVEQLAMLTKLEGALAVQQEALAKADEKDVAAIEAEIATIQADITKLKGTSTVSQQSATRTLSEEDQKTYNQAADKLAVAQAELAIHIKADDKVAIAQVEAEIANLTQIREALVPTKAESNVIPTRDDTPVKDVSTNQVVSGSPFVDIAAGGNSTCALTSTGSVYCWGYNEDGQLGDGTIKSKNTPTAMDMSKLPAGVQFTQISMAADASCGLGSDSIVYCWGKGTVGQLGNGDKVSSSLPVAVVMPEKETFSAVYAHAAGACALSSKDAALWCWGTNYEHELADGTNGHAVVPQKAIVHGGGDAIASLSAGDGSRNCMITDKERLLCWGGSGGEGYTDMILPKNALFTQVDVSKQDNLCGIAGDNQIYCAGDNSEGQLGNPAAGKTPAKDIFYSPDPTTLALFNVKGFSDMASGGSGWMLAVEKVNDTKALGGTKLDDNTAAGTVRDPKTATSSPDMTEQASQPEEPLPLDPKQPAGVK